MSKHKIGVRKVLAAACITIPQLFNNIYKYLNSQPLYNVIVKSCAKNVSHSEEEKS